MRYRYLDGLRGLAALIVVVDHFAISFFPAAVDIDAPAHHAAAIESLIESTPLHLLVAGNFSVCIFFVLSGFVLSARFFKTKQRSVVVAYAIKRYWRLAVPVITSVMLAFLLIKLHVFSNNQLSYATGSAWLRRFWQTDPSFWQALYHGTIGVFISGKSDQFNTVLWTMKSELIGSFLVFIILYAVGKWRYRVLIYALLAILLFRTYYIAFLAGLVICDYYHTGSGRLQTWLQKGWWIPLVLISLYLGSSPVDGLRHTPFQYLTPLMPLGLSVAFVTHIVGAIGLVLAILYAPPLQRLLARKPMTYLGNLSFGLYLTHLFIIGSFSSLVFRSLLPHLSYGLSFVIMLIPSGLLIWLVAHLFMNYVDKSTIQLSTTFHKRVMNSYKLLFSR